MLSNIFFILFIFHFFEKISVLFWRLRQNILGHFYVSLNLYKNSPCFGLQKKACVFSFWLTWISSIDPFFFNMKINKTSAIITSQSAFCLFISQWKGCFPLLNCILFYTDAVFLCCPDNFSLSSWLSSPLQAFLLYPSALCRSLLHFPGVSPCCFWNEMLH